MAYDAARFSELFEKLNRCAEVRIYDATGETEAERLTHALIDCDESFKKVANELLPRLMNEKDEKAMADLLEEIREEIRHIAYHIHDSRYLRIVVEQLDM